MNYQLVITHENKSYIPSVLEGVVWETERKGIQGKLSFKIVLDEKIIFTEGDCVTLKVDKANVFSGFIFSISNDKDNIASITAYDQLRYLKNKDTYKIENQTASEVIKLLANDFNLKCGDIEDTSFKIKRKIEDNQTLFDIIQNALDLTLANTGNLYIFYDDFGKLTLKSLSNMKTNILIDDECLENYDYNTSIDNNTYNQIKLSYANEESQKREIFIEKDSNNIKQWGLLQYFEDIKENANAINKAKNLLKLYNQKSKSLTLKNVCGNTNIRAGSLIMTSLKIRNEKFNTYMLVEKCTHTFNENNHTMDLTLEGGKLYA